jgi:hypothetical protein
MILEFEGCTDSTNYDGIIIIILVRIENNVSTRSDTDIVGERVGVESFYKVGHLVRGSVVSARRYTNN